MLDVTRREALRIGGLAAATALTGEHLFAAPPSKDELIKLTSNLPKWNADRLAKSRKFIDSLELAENPAIEKLASKALNLRDQPPQAFVNDGSVQAFVSGMSEKLRHDVLNSTLLAQLAATKKFDRFRDSENWYKFYREVLENVGWVIQAFDFTKFETSGDTFSVASDVIGVLLAICTGDESALVQSALNAVKNMTDGDSRLVLFETESHSTNQGSFQISAAAEDKGLAVLKFGGFRFDSSQNVTRVLFFSFSSASASLFKGAQTVVLNDDVYSKVRADIVTKLGDKAKKYIKDIEI